MTWELWQIKSNVQWRTEIFGSNVYVKGLSEDLNDESLVCWFIWYCTSKESCILWDTVVGLITAPGTLGSYQPLNWAWLAGVCKWRHVGLNITERNYQYHLSKYLSRSQWTHHISRWYTISGYSWANPTLFSWVVIVYLCVWKIKEEQYQQWVNSLTHIKYNYLLKLITCHTTDISIWYVYMLVTSACHQNK